MHQDLSREIHSEILNLKKEVVTWQSDALKGTENLIRDMEQSIRGLSEQVKALTSQVSASTAAHARTSTPRSNLTESTTVVSDYSHMGKSSAPPMPSGNTSFLPPYSQPSSWVNAPMPPPIQQPLGPPPQTLLPVNIPQQQHVQQPRHDDWDDTFLNVLGLHDQAKLRELLSRTPPDVAMPSGQPSPLSQTVILALIHRLALSLTELSPADEAFKTQLWWLQRTAYSLNPNDNIIAPYIGRVLQTAVSTLNTTAQRLNVLPGGPSLVEASNLIGQIQQSLSSLMT